MTRKLKRRRAMESYRERKARRVVQDLCKRLAYVTVRNQG